ncbi:MAG: DUF349 domain-containing protein [Prevotellaceae bacterium]|nr:DUF349 domain-containing protein [Prevotellaceae bacterium]MDD6007931.1 DUF349 domain-containing protein [Prevotellaceae bacterium]MDD6110830.1 DUF349 domain-containing protein [Prevotellaceae bacterium]MDD6779631.1 DUF349 domain-containing protein [Prevotellaceae bacterium]
MMDSQEKDLETGKIEEVNKVEEPLTAAIEPEETSEVETPADNEAPEVERRVYASKKEIVERIKEIAHGEENPDKDEVDYLKTVFYKMHIAEREAAYKAFVESGADPTTFQILPDEDEEVFKAEMGIVKERRAKIFREQEEEKEANLKRKLEIIEKIKTMVGSPEEANKSYQEFKTLQQEWKEIRNIPAAKVSELWRNYQLYVEQFYDMLKLNSEAREYDFKKNLEKKTHLCEAAERLADEPDTISAFHQLQKLHQEYRETGPVAKELREEIWNRFKAASTVINKRHQQYFDDIRKREEDNLTRKTALCERIEALIAEPNKNFADWEKHTKEIIDIQTEWKTIGFAPQKMNVKIFERFRESCDKFFSAKTEYFKALKETYKANADKKRALIEKAKELKDSTEWKKTSDKLIALQKEWKTIGVVPKKLGDQLWEEFLSTCNAFFDARNKAGAGQRSEEHANLEKKRGVIAQLKQLAEEAQDDVQQTVQKLVEEYNGIGHVPFKEKDKLYDEYHSVLDEIYKKLHINVTRKRLNNFKNKLKNVAEQGGNALDNERARLMRQYEQLKNEAQTYENNLGFLNASSKKGNSLIDEMNRKVQKLKDEIALVRDKIKAIDQQK